MAIFLDTGFFLGLCHPEDEYHKSSIKLLKIMSTGKYGIIYTSYYVISEVATLLLIRTNNNQVLLEKFFNLIYGIKPFCQLIHSTPENEVEIFKEFLKLNSGIKKKEKYLSFVDVSNIYYCQSKKIENIISYDGHFDGFLTRIY